MPEPITFRHSFNSGDLLTCLPGIKKVCEDHGRKALIYQRLNLPADYSHTNNHPVKNEDGIHVCMNENMFSMLKPLIEYQDYIQEFKAWQGESVDFDFDLTRQNALMPLPGGDIHHWPSLIHPQLSNDASKEWLNAPLTSVGDRILINRTERYRNPYISFFFLKKFPPDKFAFIGTEQECIDFNRSWGLEIILAEVNNFLHLASAIKSCAFFIGNQSMCWHIADGLKVPRILEVCASFPNTFPTGEGGYAFINQGSLEYFFDKLINETL